MTTRPLSGTAQDIRTAARLIQDEKLVVFPTETVYGLGANAFSDTAVSAIFTAKGRPQDNPLIVHIGNTAQLQDIAVSISPKAKLLFDTFAPGPLTIVLEKSKHISSKVSAGLDTVAVRIPSHFIARKFLQECEVPVAAPSANISGRPSPTSFKMAWNDMQGRVDAVIDGSSCTVGLESTVIRITENNILLLRPGAITKEMLTEITDLPVITPRQLSKVESPGIRYAHYQPDATVYLSRNLNLDLIKHFPADQTAIFSVNTLKPNHFTCIHFHSIKEYAQKLYTSLVEMDHRNIRFIIAETVSEEGLGLALMNRLKKSSAGKYVEDLSFDS